jgi:hypothetical protein
LSSTFRSLRVLALLLVLLLVAVGTWRDRVRSTQWRVPLFVAVYPIAADDSPHTRAYVAALNRERFSDIDGFFKVQAADYGLALKTPLQTRLQPAMDAIPPERRHDAGMAGTMLWSLKLRYWAWRHSTSGREPADIRIFVLYHDPSRTLRVPHSLGLQKGLIGVVYAFAREDMDGSNNVVIAHEILHTLGATDKYDYASDAPRFPDGYGDPTQSPLFPQARAEVMGGRRMISRTQWEQPATLSEVVIGAATALEIRWPAHAS